MQDTASVVSTFFEKYPQRTHSKGEVLIQAGTKPAGVFYLAEGRVSQYDISPTGNIIVVNVFKPQAFFPMSWAINQTPNKYFFEADSDVITYTAPRQAVLGFLQENPAVSLDLLARVYRGTDGLLRRMAHLMGGTASTRLQFELLNAAQRFGQPHPGGQIFVPIKEHELASRSGLARETVSRIIQQLKKSDLIDVTHSGFTLLDPKRLEESLGVEL